MDDQADVLAVLALGAGDGFVSVLDLREDINDFFRSIQNDSGRSLFVTRRLGHDKLIVQLRRRFESDPHEQPFLITVQPGPDALRIGDDGAIRVPARSGA